jgi:serine protease inhibitor
MKRTKLFFIPVVMVLIAALLFSGCTSIQSVNNLMANIKAVDWPEPPEKPKESSQKPMMDFSWNMFKSTLEDEGNVLISPASIYLALAMTMNGADGDTLLAMKDALSAMDISQEELNASCRDLVSILRNTTEKTNVSIVNSIWFRQNYNVAEEFLKTNAEYFDAAAQALDFDSPKTVEIINNWVKEQTQGKIEDIIDDIKNNTIMYLINAVYFKSDWAVPFKASDTATGNFIGPKGNITVDFMNRTGDMKYLDTDSEKGVLLPYDEGKYSFFAVMPSTNQNIRTYINGLENNELLDLVSSMKNGQVTLSLPKFEFSYKNSLNDELTSLGMGVAFTEKADLSRINAEGISELFISDVMHKTFCRVDEKGTEAAAVTKVEITLKCAPAEGVKIRFDRPFIFGIIDSTSGTPLFLGIMENPAD